MSPSPDLAPSSPPPIGDVAAQPRVELMVIPHSSELVTAEEEMSLALVALIGGNRLDVATSDFSSL